jgi:hypothetical protein
MMFWIAVVMSAFYLAVLYVVIASQTATDQPWPETFKQSALYLGIIQGWSSAWLENSSSKVVVDEQSLSETKSRPLGKAY